MQWLHFSDFHIGRAPSAERESLSMLLDCVNRTVASLPEAIDAVFLVGDIAYSGQESEYICFENEFLEPLLAIPAMRDARVFAVPGNHDVDCDAAIPITWESIRERNQAVYFYEDDYGHKARQQRAPIFSSYLDFTARHNILSPNPFEEVSKLFERVLESPFDILAVNTSFFSDKQERSSDPITPCPISSIRNRLSTSERKRPTIVLGHHSPQCFLKSQQQHFTTLLIDNKLVYLHGHEHTSNVESNVNGTLRSLGFGASYSAPLDTDTPAPFRNTFALCRLDDSLNLRSFSWDSDSGRWSESTRSQFPNCITSETFVNDWVVLNLPSLASDANAPAPASALQDIRRRTPQPHTTVLVAAPSKRVWRRLLALSDTINTNYQHISDPVIQSATEHDGKFEFVLEEGDNRDLLLCIPGVSHVLSAKEIETCNTRLDTEGYRSVTVLSLGKISHDANDMYQRLRTRKSIEVLTNRDITGKSQQLLSTSQAECLTHRDAATDSVQILVDDDQIHLLIVNSSDDFSFRVIEPSGNTLSPAHSVVTALRNANPTFSKMAYDGHPASDKNTTSTATFDENAYLRRCHEDNNVMQYAALANVGLRFSDFSLENVYVDASACEISPGDVGRLDALLEDHLAAYPVSEKIKAAIKQQYVDNKQSDTRQESSQAREYCQKFGAVLLTGDPGSGKTCFVKSEIIEYAKRALTDSRDPEQDRDEWHSVHIPVMVQLSQAAAEADLQDQGLLGIAARLLERKGLHFPHATMEDLLKEGRLALFFDGLDEVVSVEKRAIVVQQINDLVSRSLQLGNRIVVTSRPAAINVVNLLPALRQLELQGLTESEIRILASRILTLKLSDTSEGVVLDANQPRTKDSVVVRELLKDCAEKPGVARLAKNPLLLTLLVMIYANSGAPSAKRHRIYEEAIKTLASVRGRQTGHDPVSVQDLRERLGAVALSVYHKESGLLPTRSEVTEVVRGVMQRQRGAEVAAVDADRFIQKVAESTGLIALGGSDASTDGAAILTFMHHSFMEYFAAVGLTRELDKVDVASLVTQPRWVEILTLWAGIIGENEDIAPVLANFINDGTAYGAVDCRYLLFALDCALECEVPSEAAIHLLSTSIAKCVVEGPARCDPWVRSEIGHRLSQLIAACGLSAFESTLSELIRHTDDSVCAAAISLSGYACNGDLHSSDICCALEGACSRVEESVQCAICDAASRVTWFRSHAVLQVVAKCLKKSERCQRAAFESILTIPRLAADHWPAIINGLDANAPAIRRLASRAAVQAGLDGDVAALNETKKVVVANAFQHIYESDHDHEYMSGAIQPETIERLAKSGLLRDRLIGIQLIPAVNTEGDYAYRNLMKVLNESEDHQEITAALRAMRSSREARVLFTVGDLKRIAALVAEGTSDVRKASIQLLGHFGADIHAIQPLVARDTSSLATSEYTTLCTALGRAQVCQDEVANVIDREIMAHLRASAKRNRSHVTRLCALLDAAQNFGKNLEASTATSVRNTIGNYKEDDYIRRAALRAFPAIAMPTTKVVEYLTELFKSPPPSMTTELVQTPAIFAKNCRQSVDYVIACVEAMFYFRDAAIALHQKLCKRKLTAESEYAISELRNGITEITEIIVTFDEFIDPARNGGT